MRYFSPAFIIKYINAYKSIGRWISRFALDDTHLLQLTLTTHVHTLLIYAICFMWQIMAALSHHSESEARERMYIYNMKLWTHWSQHDCHRSPRPPQIHTYLNIADYVCRWLETFCYWSTKLKRNWEENINEISWLITFEKHWTAHAYASTPTYHIHTYSKYRNVRRTQPLHKYVSTYIRIHMRLLFELSTQPEMRENIVNI